MKTHIITQRAVVLESLLSAQFKIQLENGKEMRAYTSGKMRLNHIKVLVGDYVTVEVRDDMSIENQVGRITRRN